MTDLTPTQLAEEFARLMAEYEDRGLAVVQGRCNLAEYDARFHRLRDALWDNRVAIAAALTERAQQETIRVEDVDEERHDASIRRAALEQAEQACRDLVDPYSYLEATSDTKLWDCAVMKCANAIAALKEP